MGPAFSILRRWPELRRTTTALLVGAMFAPAAVRASVLVLPAADPQSPSGVGRSQWTQLTADLSAATGSQIVTSATALDDASALQACTGLWVDLGTASETLTPAESANLQAFIQTGRRAVLIGENASYSAWDGSILGSVGGTYGGGQFNGITSTLAYVPLTSGVASLNVTVAGTAASASGSTSLFQDRVATLWGPAQNAVVLLDTQALADPAMTVVGNSAFATNLADWAAGGLGVTTSWKSSLGGTWTTTGSWSAGAMPSVADSAVFNLGQNGAGAGGYTVTVPGSKYVSGTAVQADRVTLALTGGPAALQVSQAISVAPPGAQAGALTFTRGLGTVPAVVSANSIAIGGGSGSTATLTLSTGVTLNAATASVAAGASIQQNGGVLTIAGNFAGAGSVVQTAGTTAAASLRLGSFALDGGSVSLMSQSPHDADASVSVLTSLSLAESGSTFLGTLDLSDNDLVVTDGDLGALTAALASGYAGGKWDGPGIDSSAAAADTTRRTALGILQNNDGHGGRLYGIGAPLGLFDGQDPALNAILIKYTSYGDNDLSGSVNAADAARDVPGPGDWATGDFNYDGIVDASDIATQGLALAAGVSGSGNATVPEPGVCLSAVIGAGLLSTRRVRR